MRTVKGRVKIVSREVRAGWLDVEVEVDDADDATTVAAIMLEVAAEMDDPEFETEEVIESYPAEAVIDVNEWVLA